MLRDARKTELRELLSLYCQKPEKVDLFMGALDTMLINGQLVFKLTWSWWAFFFSWAWFLYRKQYQWAAIFFAASIFTGMFGLNILVMGVAGVSAKYLYLKKFTEDLQTVGYGTRTVESVKSDMRRMGGYHNWVVILIVLFFGLGLMASLMSLLTGGI